MSVRRIALSIAIACVSGLAAGSAHAWQPLTSSQPTWSGTVPYKLNESGSDDLGGFSATESIVRDGFEDWTRVSCTSLSTSYEGSTTGMPFSGGTNVVGWVESGWTDDPNAIGVTGPRWGYDNEIVSASMAMNGVSFTWTTDSGAGSYVNAYSIALHEAGHWFGLGHSSDAGATMYYAYGGGISSLNADDEDGICTLYPGGGGGATDCTSTGCPAGEECVGGTCMPTGDGGDGGDTDGSGGLCDPCSSDADCASGAMCLRYPDGGGHCGGACASDTDCDGGTCETVSDGSKQCVRRDSSGDPSCTAPPPSDEGTIDDGDDSGTGTGTDSGTDTDTGSGTEGGTDGDTGTSGNAVGDPCVTNDDCASGICAVDEETEETFCTAMCREGGCPAGFSCRDASGVMLCVPVDDETGTGTGTTGSGAGPEPESRGLTGGCHASGTRAARSGVPALALLALALGLLGARRRRRG